MSWSRSSPSAARGSGCDNASTSALARPRVLCSSSRVAMYDGHITPVEPLRQTPMFMHRSAAPRMPPVLANESRVESSNTLGSATSRRLSVIGGALTIFPGFISACGSKSRFTSHIAS